MIKKKLTELYLEVAVGAGGTLLLHWVILVTTSWEVNYEINLKKGCNNNNKNLL